MEERRTRRQQQSEDGEDHIGRHVAAVLRSLPARQRAVATLTIEQVLVDVRFNQHESDDTHSARFNTSQY